VLRGPYAACVLRVGGWEVGETITLLCRESQRRSSHAQSMLWGSCGAVYALAPSFGHVGRQRHAGNTRACRALHEGDTKVDAFVHSVVGTADRCPSCADSPAHSAVTCDHYARSFQA